MAIGIEEAQALRAGGGEQLVGGGVQVGSVSRSPAKGLGVATAKVVELRLDGDYICGASLVAPDALEVLAASDAKHVSIDFKDGSTIWEDHFRPEIVDAFNSPDRKGEIARTLLLPYLNHAATMFASEYATRDVVPGIGDPRVRYLRQANRGAGAARNTIQRAPWLDRAMATLNLSASAISIGRKQVGQILLEEARKLDSA